MADCLPLVQHLLNKTEIGVVREDRASRLVLMNRTELQQVLINLIVNAIHAMPDGGTLALRSFDAERDGSPGIVIEVADTGVGMPADMVEKVFDPFFTTKRREGTGLGLVHKSDIDQAPAWPDHGGKRNRPRKHISRLASRGRLIPTVRTFCPAKSGHFVLGCSAVIHKSLISCIVRFGTWIAHSSSTS